MSTNSDNLLSAVASLMNEQAEAYSRLEEITRQLSGSMVRNDLIGIEQITREGEKELTRMRSKLLEIMSALTHFAESRAEHKDELTAETKQEFEMFAKKLIEAARVFSRISERTANLALGGSSFASACIQFCGIPPSTYNKPVLNRPGAHA